MTMIRSGSSIKREIRSTVTISPINVEIDEKGMSFWVKGSRKRVWLTWTQAIRAGYTESDVPSFLMGKPAELLQHYAAKKKVTEE